MGKQENGKIGESVVDTTTPIIQVVPGAEATPVVPASPTVEPPTEPVEGEVIQISKADYEKLMARPEITQDELEAIKKNASAGEEYKADMLRFKNQLRDLQGKAEKTEADVAKIGQLEGMIQDKDLKLFKLENLPEALRPFESFITGKTTDELKASIDAFKEKLEKVTNTTVEKTKFQVKVAAVHNPAKDLPTTEPKTAVDKIAEGLAARSH